MSSAWLNLFQHDLKSSNENHASNRGSDWSGKDDIAHWSAAATRDEVKDALSLYKTMTMLSEKCFDESGDKNEITKKWCDFVQSTCALREEPQNWSEGMREKRPEDFVDCDYHCKSSKASNYDYYRCCNSVKSRKG